MLERVNAFSEYYVSVVSSNSLLSIRKDCLFGDSFFLPEPTVISSGVILAVHI